MGMSLLIRLVSLVVLEAGRMGESVLGVGGEEVSVMTCMAVTCLV